MARAKNRDMRTAPHPRAAVSGRMSADEFRAMMGRESTRGSIRSKLARVFSLTRGPGKPKYPLREPAESELSELPLEFVLPFLPPSINSIFASVTDPATGRPRRVLTTRARALRKEMSARFYGRLKQGAVYELHITVELSALTKDGKIRKVDLTNRVKFLEDCVSSSLGIDDRQFFRVVLNKVHAEQERTVIRILPFREDRIAA